MIKFMHAVYDLVRERIGSTLTDTNHIVYIATPSGWDKAAQNLYGEMAAKAGIPIAGVTWESRAAFIKAQIVQILAYHNMLIKVPLFLIWVLVHLISPI